MCHLKRKVNKAKRETMNFLLIYTFVIALPSFNLACSTLSLSPVPPNPPKQKNHTTTSMLCREELAIIHEMPN